ncbi:MAG TPA: DUF885 domain-containing protein, partial [Candidatus Baltobacteraceae bacterium]|nr:DUF885 domain-containing protein [Candidatus Baltobacteraceae bacterium]
QLDNSLRVELGEPVEAIRAVSYDDAVADADFGRKTAASLNAIDAKTLDHDHWLTYRTLQFRASNDSASQQYFWLEQRATPYAGGLQLSETTQIFTGFTFSSERDASRYVALLHQYAAYVRSLRSFLEGQHARRIILPVSEIDATQALFEGYAASGALSPLLLSGARLGRLSPPERSALTSSVATIISSELRPAFLSVASYLKGAYRANAPSGVGLSQYPGGAQYYAFLIRYYTTLSVSAADLHASGLRQVDTVNRKLDAVRREAHFSGNLAAFKHFLATDKRFFAKNAPEIGDRLEVYVQRSASQVPRYFARTPTSPYGVAQLPAALAKGQTFGYYSPATSARNKGIYFYNASAPAQASILGAGALICHELIPGHHFQIALQQENSALPKVRHYDFTETGFVEGWGEYASQLCWDMGVYQTPYDRAGRLMQDLMVSTRLVVDTGMNAMGWSRARAMQYMRDNLTLSEPQIETESLRYSTDIPGQALAYKTGELTMLGLRAHAQKELGKSFDMRTFHGWLIDSGAMTLDTLRQHVQYEIDVQKRSNV